MVQVIQDTCVNGAGHIRDTCGNGKGLTRNTCVNGAGHTRDTFVVLMVQIKQGIRVVSMVLIRRDTLC